jgi:hypothetical protein
MKIIGTRTEDEWLEDYIVAALGSVAPKDPPEIQKLGAVTASWFETEPGICFVNAVGGTPDDRIFARLYLGSQLKARGYKTAQFSFDQDEEFRKTAAWSDIDVVMERP